MNFATFKTKTFWLAIASIVAGCTLSASGLASIGAPLIAQGLIGIGLRDAISNLPK